MLCGLNALGAALCLAACQPQSASWLAFLGIIVRSFGLKLLYTWQPFLPAFFLAMAEKQNSLRALAIAGVGACALSSGLSFVTGQASHQASPQVATGLRGAQQTRSGNGFSSTMLGLAGAGAVTAASMGVSQRQRVVRRAEFAAGMAGSKLHGWGEYQFDPAGFATSYPELLGWFREAELKHGRVAMLAYVGLIVPDAVRLPFEEVQDPSLDLLTAHNKLIGPGLGEGPMWWLLLACGVIESLRFKQVGLAFESLTAENAGDLGLRMFAPSSAEGMESMKMKELKNGRLAMLAISGALTQGVLFNAHHFPFMSALSSETRSGIGSRSTMVGTAASMAVSQRQRVVRRAEFAAGMAGSKLHGWGEYQFDPAGFATSYPELLGWFREAELKHGRVAMLAYVGLIVPDAVRLPFEEVQDPSLDLLTAHNKLIGPGLGEGPMWWLLLACGVIESLRFKQVGLAFESLTAENAGDLGLRMFAPSSAEGMESMKMKELKNGRLAMLAISGALTQGVLFNAHHFPFTP